MMKRVLLAVAMLALSAATSFAADAAGDSRSGMPGMQGMSGMQEGSAAGGGMKEYGCDKMMMQNPEQLLVMAFHRNVITFGKTLEKVARQRDTVPGDFARTVLAEMRRSVEQVEKYRAGAMAGMPAGMKSPEMQKRMDEHLVNVKTHLRELDELAKSDTIPSGEVLKHLQAIFQGCQGASCAPSMHGMKPDARCRKHMQGGSMHGPGCQGSMHDCRKDCHHDCRNDCHHDCGKDCDHDCCGHGPMAGGGAGMMQQHRQLMMQMTQKIKAQDAEMQKMVDKMKKAPKNKKVDQLAAIVAKLVQQRAEMTAQMEKMQKQALGGEPRQQLKGDCPQAGGAEEAEDQMEMDDMKMQEGE